MFISDFFFWKKPNRRIRKIVNNFLESAFNNLIIHTNKKAEFLLTRPNGKVKIILSDSRVVIYDNKFFTEIVSDLDTLFEIKDSGFLHKWIAKKYKLKCKEFKFYNLVNIPWYLV